MDKELPAKIWVPALAACALVPLAALKPHAVSGIIVLGVLGVGGYLVVKAIRAKRRLPALGYAFGTLFVGGMIAHATAPPPTADELAARSRAQREYQATKQAQAAVPCNELQAAIRDMDAQIAYVERTIAADRTLQVDAALAAKLESTKLATTNALAEYARRCQSR